MESVSENMELKYNAEEVTPRCAFCNKCEDELMLTDMETNSLCFNDRTIEYGELLFEVFQFRLDSGLICTDCQNNVVQFYCLKDDLMTNMKSREWSQRQRIVKKLDMFLEDYEQQEELIVLRYNQCFAIVPESKRAMMQNFQTWQPRVTLEPTSKDSLWSQPAMPELVIRKNEMIEPADVIVEEIEEGESAEETVEKIEEVTQNYDELIEEDAQFPPSESAEQNSFFIVEEADEDSMDVEEFSSTKKFNPSKEQCKWANETTKECYSVETSEEGIVPIWTCLLCQKVYKSAQALRVHLLSKHLNEETETNQLPQDIREWIRKEYRERRALIETFDGSKFEWTCGICKFTCTASKTFRAHLIETHIKNNKPAVGESSEKTLNYHQQQWIQSQIHNEPDKWNWKCTKCDEGFNTGKKLRQHLARHVANLTVDDIKSAERTSTRPRKTKAVRFSWTCKECWFQFSAQRSFDAHMKLHETLRLLNPFIDIHHCNDCNWFFRSSDDLLVHQNGHHLEGQPALLPAEGVALQKTILFKRLLVPCEVKEGNSTCGHCGRQFLDENSCKGHLLIHHINPLVCPKDGRQFTSIQPFISHLQKVHSEMIPQSLQCNDCKMQLENIYEKLAHYKICNSRKFCCDHCDRKFSNKSYLNSHLKRVMGLLKCHCMVCGKEFKAKDELSTHMRTHTKEKPYHCSICDKRYTTNSARASHMETHKDTVIQCEVCAVKFVARRHYVVHFQRYHDEGYRERKFQELTCQVCAKQFLRKDRLREHMIRVHDSNTPVRSNKQPI